MNFGCFISFLTFLQLSVSIFSTAMYIPYSFTSFFKSHYMTTLIEVCPLHGLFNVSLLFLWFVPSVQFTIDISYFRIYSSTTLPAKFCNFNISILNVLSKIFHSFDLEIHLLPFSVLLTTLSFYFVKKLWLRNELNSKSHKYSYSLSSWENCEKRHSRTAHWCPTRAVAQDSVIQCLVISVAKLQLFGQLSICI